MTQSKIKIHTSSFLRLNLDLLHDDGWWGLYSLYHPRRKVRVEMTWLVIVETHLILLAITDDTHFFSTLVAFEILTCKPVVSVTLAADVEVPLTSIRLVICNRLISHCKHYLIVCLPSIPLSHFHIKFSFSDCLNNLLHSLKGRSLLLELENHPIGDLTNDIMKIF